jgi:peptidoglycan/LPS O-acetylase OafA/YrhL
MSAGARGPVEPESANVAERVPVNSAKRFAPIDALRAFAVALVLFEHAGFTKIPGDAGVTVFFTISGFIITFILLRERDRTGRFDVGRFYRRRALKLAPPFVVAILIPTLIYAIFSPVSWGAVASQVLFSYNWVQVFAEKASYLVLPGSDVVWSLAVEEQFYIVFALIWLLLVRRRWWAVGLTTVAVLAIVTSNTLRLTIVLSGQYLDHPDRLLRATDARMDAIAWGVLAAVGYHLWESGRLRWISRFSHDAVAIAAVVVFFGMYAYQSPSSDIALRGALQPICALAIILYSLQPTGSRLQNAFYRVTSWRWVQLIGLASYSLYIGHDVVVAPLYDAVLSALGLWLGGAVLIALGAAVGFLIYFLVERPVLAWRVRRGW